MKKNLKAIASYTENTHLNRQEETGAQEATKS